MTESAKKRRRGTYKGDYTALDGSDNEESEFEHVESEDELPQTPTKRRTDVTPRKTKDLDQSARKRATKVLMRRAVGNDELDEEDEALAEKIIAESRGTPQKPRLSPKKQQPAVEQSSESRIRQIFGENYEEDEGFQSLFLDGAEGYFDQHKSRERVSTTPFSKAPTISYQEFVDYVKQGKEIHQGEREFLQSLYRTMFRQWYFELSQGFNLVFYGIGSKRELIMDFASETLPEELPVLVINGYNPATTFKEILNSAVSVLVRDERERKSFPKSPLDLLNTLLAYLEKRDSRPQLALVIHNIDGEALRGDKTQFLLAQLASAKQIWMMCSIDHIQTPILWDAAKMSLYNFLWHDLTTYELYTVETSFEDPLALGKNRSAVGTKGVKYVLSSLTANARSLYKLLLSHQLEVMTEELPPEDTSTVGTSQFGIEFKRLYQKCVEEFIASNELNFRTMLTEFLEHKMLVSSKDNTGVEYLFIPFTKDYIQQTLEELMDM
jgi:origin recognition complex subunit 2